MKMSYRIGVLLAILIATTLYVVYRKIEEAESKLMARDIELREYAISAPPGNQLIDAAYCTFMLPDDETYELSVDAHVLGHTLMIKKKSDGSLFLFLMPTDWSDGSLVSDYNDSFDPDVPNYWELETLACGIKKFSLWETPLIGWKETKRRVYLQSIRGMLQAQNGAGTIHWGSSGTEMEFRLLESDFSFLYLQIYLPRKQWKIQIGISDNLESSKPLVDSIVQTFRLTEDFESLEAMNARVLEAGFPAYERGP